MAAKDARHTDFTLEDSSQLAEPQGEASVKSALFAGCVW